MKLSEAKLEELARILDGSCADIEYGLFKVGEKPIGADHKAIAEQLRVVGLELCGGCRWWYNSYELSEGQCVDCKR